MSQRSNNNNDNNRNEDINRCMPNLSGASGTTKRWFLPNTQKGRVILYTSFGVLFSIGSFYGVWWSMESEKARRHTSIARDIEREKWRRKQLGLPDKDVYDDGFAEIYENQEKNKRDVILAKESIRDTAKTLGKEY